MSRVAQVRLAEMAASEIMERYGWHDVWMPNKGAWFVGNWTGPEYDLLCLTYCRTNRQGRRFLSPEGKTLTDAIMRARVKISRMVAPKKGCSGGTGGRGFRDSSKRFPSSSSCGSPPRNRVPFRSRDATARGSRGTASDRGQRTSGGGIHSGPLRGRKKRGQHRRGGTA